MLSRLSTAVLAQMSWLFWTQLQPASLACGPSSLLASQLLGSVRRLGSCVSVTFVLSVGRLVHVSA